MDYKSKNKVLYKGFLLECILLIFVPVLLYIAFRVLFNMYFPYRHVLNEVSAKVLGFGLGSVFHMACFVCGAFRDSIAAIRRRIGNFIENAELSIKIAAKEYLSDIKTEGVEFWAYFVIMAVCFSIAFSGLIDYLSMMGLTN